MVRWSVEMRVFCGRVVVAAMALVGFAGHATAASIVLTPSDATVTVGDTFDISVNIVGLEDDYDPDQIVAAYDLSVLFDALLVSDTGVIFGTDLGGPLDSIQ